MTRVKEFLAFPTIPSFPSSSPSNVALSSVCLASRIPCPSLSFFTCPLISATPRTTSSVLPVTWSWSPASPSRNQTLIGHTKPLLPDGRRDFFVEQSPGRITPPPRLPRFGTAGTEKKQTPTEALRGKGARMPPATKASPDKAPRSSAIRPPRHGLPPTTPRRCGASARRPGAARAAG